MGDSDKPALDASMEVVDEEVFRLEPGQQEPASRHASSSVSHEQSKFYHVSPRKFPRTYHVLSQIIIPLLLLIGLAFFGGYLIALAESGAEQGNNDAKMVDLVDRLEKINQLARAANDTHLLCLESYTPTNGDIFNRTELELHMQTCGNNLSAEIDDIVQDFVGDLRTESYDTLTFDWNLCQENETSPTDQRSQARLVVESWVANYEIAKEEYGNETDAAKEKAFAVATGHEKCSINTGAGALFFFTVMTTIGYGNTAPITAGGRATIYTLGFLSILCFTATIGQAGYIMLVVVDDFFLRNRLKRLTKGVPAVLFWLIVFIVWLLVIAAIVGSWKQEAVSSGMTSFEHAIWFAYISVTTVGLGDYYVSTVVSSFA